MKKLSIGKVLLIQLVVVFYTFATVIGKFAAGASRENLWRFLGLYAAELAVLGVYAILWQQVIKRIPLSVAYANRAVALLWSLLWAVLIFHEQATLQKVLGVLLVVAGTAVINSGEGRENGV